MDKYELAAHLANLTFIMEFHEKLGTNKNPHIVKEFYLGHADLVEKLKKEQSK